jgi:two-component system, OmpR family, phosphate regulon response regulator OmpR
MSARTTILVVDDECEIRDMLEEYLSKQCFEVYTADGGVAMRQTVSAHQVDVVLLDIRMPGEDGLSLARYLREHAQVGIIMVTAAGEAVDRIVGLEMGADDYVTKPFNPRELVARIKSVLRRLRTASPQASEGAAAPQRLRFGQCFLDLQAHKLFTLEGKEIPITAMEFDLLQVFATHPHRVLTRDQLLEMAHNRDWEPFDRSIDIRIARLRRKIEADPAKPQTIKTVRGAGYIFMPHTDR